MDHLVRELSASMKDVKSIRCDSAGVFLNGQVPLFLSATFIDTSIATNDIKYLLIHRHFARLSDENTFALYAEGGSLMTENSAALKPAVMFSLKNDVLLFLSLVGGYIN